MLRSAGNILKVTLIFVFLFCQTAYSFTAEDVEVINNRDYFPSVRKLLQQANESIYVIMFSVYYYDQYPDSPSNVLLEDLAAAKKRGVDVRVILEQEAPASSGWFREKKIQPEQLQRVTKFLERNGIPYTLDSQDTMTHAKLIIVDGLYTVIGSTNWSYSAMAKNNETAVIIKSKEVAKSYIEYFKKLD